MTTDHDEFQDELNDLRAQGLQRQLTVQDDPRQNFSSNDYLGLSRHPFVAEAAVKAIGKCGIGGTSSRLLAGTSSFHKELELALAHFLKKESALVFSSGYHANTGILPVVAGSRDVIFFDRLCHASLIDGIKLSGATFFSFNHNDRDDLESILNTRRNKYRRAWIVTEGVFSMDGDLPPLEVIIDLAGQWNAYTYLDEAHSFGLMGLDGRGVAASLGLLDKIDVFVGTLSKSLGSQGGFVASTKPFIDLLISRCRSFIYTTALAPSCAAAALAALRLLPAVEDRRRKIWESAEIFRKELEGMGYSSLKSRSQIVPVWTGTIEMTKKLADHLLAQGFFVPSIRPPTVPAGEGRLRVSLTYDAVSINMKALLAAFKNFSERPQRTGEKIVEVG